MQLIRRFSPINMLFLSINGMIGSAWLFAPLYAAKIAGPGVIAAWVIGGVMTILIAFTFAELSTMFPVAGGTTRLPQLSHGALTSFIMSWVAWLSCVTMPPIEVQATLQYASTYFPALMNTANGVPVLSGVGFIFATIIMLLLSIINVSTFNALIRFNFALFAFKVTVIVLAVFMLIKTSFHPVNFAGASNFLALGSNWHTILAAVAGGGIAFAFTGFKHGVELAGEAKNTKVAIPLAIVGSVVCCLLLYLGLQIAFVGALDPAVLSAGWSNISFTHEAGPFVGIAAILGIAWLVKLLYIDAAVSPLGAGFVYVTSTSRIIYTMSKNGYLPKFLSHLNKRNFPYWAVALNFAVGMFLFLPLPGWQNMVNFLVSAVAISYAMGPISLICLRKVMPNATRRFRLPAAHLLCLIAFYFCNLLSYWTGWGTVSKLAIAILIGFGLFSIAYWRGHIDKSRIGIKGVLWIVPYLGGLITLSYFGSFGGTEVIPFGWDFLVVGLFSIVTFYLAIYARLETLSVSEEQSALSETDIILSKNELGLST